MAAPLPSLLPAGGGDASSGVSALHWGWLTVVAGVHVAGLAWLAEVGSTPVSPAQTLPVMLVNVLPTPANAAPATAPAPEASAARARPMRADPPRKRAAPPPETPPQQPKIPFAIPASTAPSLPEQAPPLVAAPEASAPPDKPLASLPVRREGTAAPTPGPAAAASETVDARYDAAYLDNPHPAYPNVSRRLGEEGTVVLRVRVRSDGRADEVTVAESSRHPRLDRAARDAVRAWRFVPARRGDVAIDSWLRVPVAFRLEAG